MAMVTLDELIRTVQEGAPSPLEQLSAASETAAVLGELGDSLLNHFVDRCRRSGHTWAEIGEHLGVTKQAAQKRFVTTLNDASLERFTARARAALEQARGIAISFHHAYLGTEHLLLALFQVDGGLAYEALAQLGIRREEVEERVLALIPRGTAQAPLGKPGWTPKSAQSLADALTEALELGHNYIGTEHLLLGLLRGETSVAKTVLLELGATAERVRSIIIDVLTGVVAAAPERARTERLAQQLAGGSAAKKAPAPTKRKAPAKKKPA